MITPTSQGTMNKHIKRIILFCIFFGVSVGLLVLITQFIDGSSRTSWSCSALDESSPNFGNLDVCAGEYRISGLPAAENFNRLKEQ